MLYDGNNFNHLKWYGISTFRQILRTFRYTNLIPFPGPTLI